MKGFLPFTLRAAQARCKIVPDDFVTGSKNPFNEVPELCCRCVPTKKPDYSTSNRVFDRTILVLRNYDLLIAGFGSVGTVTWRTST